jgi:LmbE family N-acetylglucosaminyl deacetylase
VGKLDPKKQVVLAIAAHPDDIEFQMAGTLLLLKQAGCETHYLNIANGSCGSMEYDASAARKVRAAEGRAAAKILGAKFHASLVNDLEIFYDLPTLRRVAAVVREAKPTIVLTHPPQDYMEDHMNACRLAITAAFAHGMPNFKSVPSRKTYHADVAVYHCMPHGLCDGLRRRVWPGAYVNTTSVHEKKLKALAAHRSQQHWLDTSQGMNSYLRTMEEMSLEIGRMSRKFKYAEGWRRHLHLGFSTKDTDPLADLLGKNYLVNKTYERNLEKGN